MDEEQAVRILGLDLGERRIGLAVSDPTGTIASGRGVYTRQRLDQDLDHLERLIEAEGIIEVVLGYPLNMDGSIGERAQQTLAFKEELEARVEVPVVLFDERLSTAEAERVLIEADLSRRRRKRVIDELSAVVILQSYLDWRRASVAEGE
ncbi:MAG: Holliday junction resolvase RuvX [Candidatus Bipolaricaulia bacterium]